jgi:hypothetical protein
MKYVLLLMTPDQIQFYRFNTREVADDIAEELRARFGETSVIVYED